MAEHQLAAAAEICRRFQGTGASSEIRSAAEALLRTRAFAARDPIESVGRIVMSMLTRRNMIGASLAAAQIARGAPANSAVTVGVLGTGSRGTFVSTMMAKNT